MNELGNMAVGVLGSILAAISISIISGLVWMRRAISDHKSKHGLMEQRMEFNEEKLKAIDSKLTNSLKELNDKMDQTLDVLTDIKLAFSEVRIKNESNADRISRIEDKIS